MSTSFARKARVSNTFVLVTLLASAAIADEVTKTYQDPTFAGGASKILVVGVHDDGSVRGQFENAVARALRAAGAAGESSLSVGGASQLSAATVVEAARRARADAVLVTQVVDVQTQGGGDSATVTEYFNAYARYQDPLPITTAHTVRVQSALYIVEGERRVWAAESTAVDKVDLFGVIDGIATALTVQLRADGLIR